MDGIEHESRAENTAKGSHPSEPLLEPGSLFAVLSSEAGPILDCNKLGSKAPGTPSWMDGIMNSVDILAACGDERPDYDMLRASDTLWCMSQGREPAANFPTPQDLGEAAELLDLIRKGGGWGHLVDEESQAGPVATESTAAALEYSRDFDIFHDTGDTPFGSLSPGKRSVSKASLPAATVNSKKARVGEENPPRAYEDDHKLLSAVSEKEEGEEEAHVVTGETRLHSDDIVLDGVGYSSLGAGGAW